MNGGGTERVVVVAVMGQDVAPAVLPPELWTRLAASADLVPGVLSRTLTAPTARAALNRVEVLLTGWGCPRLTEGVLNAAPRLRAVVHAAGSVKNLVSDGIWERGILVSSAADANAGPVADFTVAAISLAAKRALGTAAAYEAIWPDFLERRGADGRTVGIIGASRVGRRVLARLRAAEAGYRLLLHDPYVTDAEAGRLGAEPVGLAELCRASSIVTVHAPETPETRHMLDAAHLALIPDGGTVINTARGSIVATDALTRECVAGRLDAFLDVTDPEPLPMGHPLLRLPNVMVTPHIAGAQGSEARRLGAYAVAEVERWVRGEPLLGGVTREELQRLA